MKNKTFSFTVERLGFYEQAGQRWLVAGGCWLILTILFYLLS